MSDREMIANIHTPASSHLACRACGHAFADGEPVSVRFVPLDGTMIESGAYHDRCTGGLASGAYGTAHPLVIYDEATPLSDEQYRAACESFAPPPPGALP